jgi:hypothetical protein
LNSATSSARAASASSLQFQALQQHLQQSELDAALACVEQLRAQRLSAQQRGLVLHVQALVERQRGERELAWQLGLQSLELAYSPARALGYLEFVLLPVPRWSLRAQWIGLMQGVVRAGLGPQLLRQLADLLQAYPLDQQRQELLRAIEEHDGLLQADLPQIRPLWQRLQQWMHTLEAAGSGSRHRGGERSVPAR